MNNADLLHKINSILKPIAQLIIFLFTTKIGILILLSLLILWFYSKIYNKLRDRKLLNESASGEHGISLKEFLSIIFEELSNFAAYLIANFTTLLIVLVVMLSIVGLSSTFSSVEDYLNKRNQIENLKIALKNLETDYKVAKVEVLNVDRIHDSIEINVKFFDYAMNDYMPKEQTLKLPGHNIYFLMLLVNFKYSLIENGEKVNIALPYEIFTEKQTQEQGVRLQYADSLGIPFIFHRDSSEVYGIGYEQYNSTIAEIAGFLSDPKKAKKAGVVSYYDAAPHYVRTLRKGQTFEIWVQQTRGLVIKQEKW